MKKDQIKFLKKLVETPSPTGFEEQVAELVRKRLADCADEIHTDTMGSVHAILSGDAQREGYIEVYDDYTYEQSPDAGSSLADAYDEGGERLTQITTPVFMLAAHMDEIGLMVTYISDEGFLSIAAIGGVDAAILPGMRVDVHTEHEVLRGVVGRKPIHLIDADERKTVTGLDKLVIDLGLPAKEVKRKVRVGDPITFGVGFERMGNEIAVSKSFDDKCGVFIACSVLEALAKNGQMIGSFIAAITTQEEIGTRGATTSAFSINPDVAVAFDVTHATDYPGIDKTKYGDIKLGGGPVIARGPNINPHVFERLVAAAEAEDIAYQIEAEPSVTGTDARAIQISQSGIPTGLVSVPLRYMHTPNEMVSLSDIEDTIKLLTRFALDLEEDATFVPGVSPKVERPFRKDIEPAAADEAASDDLERLQREVDDLNRKIFALMPGNVAPEPMASAYPQHAMHAAPMPFGYQQPLQPSPLQPLNAPVQAAGTAEVAEMAEAAEMMGVNGMAEGSPAPMNAMGQVPLDVMPGLKPLPVFDQSVSAMSTVEMPLDEAGTPEDAPLEAPVQKSAFVARSLDAMPQAMDIQASPQIMSQLIRPLSSTSSLAGAEGDAFGCQAPDDAQVARELDDETIEYQSDAEVMNDTSACAPEGFPGIDTTLNIMPECFDDTEDER